METINIILVILLITLTAFFVASEYSIIRVRVSRINQLASEGNKNAKAVKNILSRLDEYLSACQLGTTLTSMALGWLGESTVEKLLHPLFVLAHIPAGLTGVLSFLLAFLILTYFEVVVGELVPKTFAIQIAEPMALFFARPITVFYKITYPLNWVLSRSSRVITGLFGLKKVSEEDAALSEAELRLALSEGFRSGEITPTEYRYLNNVFDFDDRAAQEIMVPRIHIRSISHQATVAEFMELIEDKVYNFLPVAEHGDRDRIIGMIRVKEALHDLARGHSTGNTTMASYIHPVLQVIETVQARDLLIQMQKRRIPVAVMVDEYGGTSGLVTLEDIMEEIVGDIPSYTDTETPAALTPLITKTDDHRYILKSQALIHEVNRRLETDIEAGDVYTIGGWMLSERFDIQQGDKLTSGLWEFTVLEKNSHQIDTIEAVKKAIVEQKDDSYSQ
ncbi:2-oxo acid dehydrogenase, lipoyl-binding site protein [Paenibacillus polymyxa SQR-21]|uniref:hemolysin family protein n=1 Tax=Paenibacillus polymyxa TaxID=1406 RepID=UPI00042EB2AF|nr:hemolysin family protein [Paenibacillus polymyxa]AHM64727.1 2-oxo acid dehydrogenase, lipoyl-binding site protein [Paenibacillus polymyxa SQR-21]